MLLAKMIIDCWFDLLCRWYFLYLYWLMSLVRIVIIDRRCDLLFCANYIWIHNCNCIWQCLWREFLLIDDVQMVFLVVFVSVSVLVFGDNYYLWLTMWFALLCRWYLSSLCTSLFEEELWLQSGKSPSYCLYLIFTLTFQKKKNHLFSLLLCHFYFHFCYTYQSSWYHLSRLCTFFSLRRSCDYKVENHRPIVLNYFHFHFFESTSPWFSTFSLSLSLLHTKHRTEQLLQFSLRKTWERLVNCKVEKSRISQ